MKPETVLGIFAGIFALTVIGIMSWDWTLYRDNTPRNSITQAIIDVSKKFPLLAWAIGFLFGFLTAHFYG